VFAGKKSAQIREILISESAWEEMTCLFAPSLVLFYRDEYEKYFDSLKDGDECLSFKDFIECLC
ncbi:hypothetical protein ACH6VX_26140, partial [Klebsiella pneumoniae]|nr:hypothetical protein [Klebsiella pneumoniae]